MQILPPKLTELIEAFGALPGVGPRTAERYAYFLVRHDGSTSQKLAKSLQELHGGIGYCKKTFALVPAGQAVSDLYSDPRRDKKVVAVVAEPFDIVALEKTGQFSATYHVVGGHGSKIEGVGQEQLHIADLVKRIDEDEVDEVIHATNASD